MLGLLDGAVGDRLGVLDGAKEVCITSIYNNRILLIRNVRVSIIESGSYVKATQRR